MQGSAITYAIALRLSQVHIHNTAGAEKQTGSRREGWLLARVAIFRGCLPPLLE
jgi:hypothetical protein